MENPILATIKELQERKAQLEAWLQENGHDGQLLTTLKRRHLADVSKQLNSYASPRKRNCRYRTRFVH